MEKNELESLEYLNEKDTLTERVLFGQFLVNKGYISYSILNEAISLQKENNYSLKIGEILLKHFGIFKNKEELFNIAEQFYETRNSIIKERKRETEKYTIKNIIEDVSFFLEKYTHDLNINTLNKAILILESEKEYRSTKINLNS